MVLGHSSTWHLEQGRALPYPPRLMLPDRKWNFESVLMLFSGLMISIFLGMCVAGFNVNLVMFAFNLFPLPPLDGGRILVGLLPWKQAVAVSRIEPWGFFIVMALVISGIVGSLWLDPLIALSKIAIGLLLSPLRWLLL